MPSYFKQEYFRSKRWLQAVASIPCVICGAENVQAAHRNEGKGMGMKVDDCLTAALCVAHHAEIDSGAYMSREKRREEIDSAILATIVQLTRRGLIGPK